MNPVIKRSMNVINNLLGYLEASRAKSRDGTMPLDYARNRCLNHIEKINEVPGGEKTPYLREAWEIYMKLQNFKAPSGERQDYDDGREIPLDNMDEDELWTDGTTVETKSPEVYSGGLGYRHVNWDSAYLMARGAGGHDNPYWRPENAKKAGEGLMEMRKVWDGPVPRNRR